MHPIKNVLRVIFLNGKGASWLSSLCGGKSINLYHYLAWGFEVRSLTLLVAFKSAKSLQSLIQKDYKEWAHIKQCIKEMDDGW